MKYDVIVIGGGIAGLTASIYIKRGLRNVLLLETATFGGQIITSPDVENYPGYEHISGAELGKIIHNQAINLGVDIKTEEVISVDGEDNNFIVNTKDNKYESKKVIIATGASPRGLDLPNEKDYIGRGLSFCATCDGNFFRNRVVAVVGGGNVAIDDALYLSNIASKVYLIHRRDEFRAEKNNVELLKNKDNVEFVLKANLKSIEGSPMINKIIVDQDGKDVELDINGLFMCIGRKPNTKIFAVDKDENGYIITDDNLETSTKGIYAIGDVRVKEVRQLTTAAADGTIAASIILKELEK